MTEITRSTLASFSQDQEENGTIIGRNNVIVFHCALSTYLKLLNVSEGLFFVPIVGAEQLQTIGYSFILHVVASLRK